jgi:hypothetical protein
MMLVQNVLKVLPMVVKFLIPLSWLVEVTEFALVWWYWFDHFVGLFVILLYHSFPFDFLEMTFVVNCTQYTQN